MFGKKSVFPAQRDDDDETMKVSRAAWDQMQQSLGAMSEKLSKLEKRSARPAPAPAPARVEAPAIKLHEPKVDLAGLPDPVTDKDGFLREASKRLQTQLDTLTATIKGQREDEEKSGRAVAQQTAKVNKLWARWTKEHPEFAKAGKIVQAEAAAMVQEGVDQGLGLHEIMFADEDGFLEDLAGRVGAELKSLGVPVAKPGEGDDPAGAAARVDKGLDQFANQFNVADDAGTRARALDMRDGDLGSLTPKKSGKQEDTPIPLTDQLKHAQEEMGLI